MEQKKAVIFMAEDEPTVLSANTRMMIRRGYDVITAMTVEESKKKLSTENPDLLVLDLMLPDGSGYDICSFYRKFSHKPVIFLTGKTEVQGKVDAMRAGGDYYITKPYDFDELLAVIERLLERDRHIADTIPTTDMSFGSLNIDTDKGRATLRGEDIGLTQKEYLLLKTLAQNVGQQLSLGELYEAAWGVPAVGDLRVVRTHISNLRAKIEADYSDSYDIISYYKKGYAFVCD